MADPLSIIASVVTLFQVSVKVTCLVKQFRDEVGVVDATLAGLLNDVDRFQQVLGSMIETFEQSDIKSNVQVTGHVGSHWKNLTRSLKDATNTLQELQSLLDGINKTSLVFDKARRQLRLRSASGQIATYREHIQSYHAALQLSLSTVILCNQVDLQKTTNKIPEKIVPTLDKLYDEFRTFGALLNAKIEKLENSATNQSDDSHHELEKMSNLRECLRSAADVVSTASSTFSVEAVDRTGVRIGSDMGDVFTTVPNETMLRWMTSKTIYEFDDVDVPLLNPSEASTDEAMTEYQSDSDSDTKSEMVMALFNDGNKLKAKGDLSGAARRFRSCLGRISSKKSCASFTSLQIGSTFGVSKEELFDLLIDTYSSLGSWGEAKSTMLEKLSITERQVGKKDRLYLSDTMKLAEILANNHEYVEAHLQGRRSLRDFKKLGEPGHKGYESCLTFLIRLCNSESKVDEEEAYIALLENHQRKTKQHASRPGSHERTSSRNQNLDGSPGWQVDTDIISQEHLEISNEEEPQTQNETESSGLMEGTDTRDTSSATFHTSSNISDHIRVGSAQSDQSSVFKEASAYLTPENDSLPVLSFSKLISPFVHTSEVPHPSTEKVGIPNVEDDTPASLKEISIPASPRSVCIKVFSDIESETSPVSTGSILDYQYQSYMPDDISTLHGKLYDAAIVEKAVNPKIIWADDLEILTAYCELFNGELPSIFTGHSGESGTWWARVEISPGKICWTFDSVTEESAIDAVIAKAYRSYVSASEEEIIMRYIEQSHPFSDRELYHAEIDATCLSSPATDDIRGRFVPNHRRAVTLSQVDLLSQFQSSSGTNLSIHSTSSSLKSPDRPPYLVEGCWACSSCKCSKLRPLSERRCAFCFKNRNDHCPSSLNNFERQPLDQYQTSITRFDTKAFLKLNEITIQREILFLGDHGCGKTWLASAGTRNPIPEFDTLIYNTFTKITKVEGHPVTLKLLDFTGDKGEHYHHQRCLLYKSVHVVVICFDIFTSCALDNIGEFWYKEVEHFLPNVPRILVGCQKDRRNNKEAWSRLEDQAISPYAADEFAKKIQALAYFETSATEKQGLGKLFNYIAEVALKNPPKPEAPFPTRKLLRRVRSGSASSY